MKDIKYILLLVVLSFSNLAAQEYHFGIRGGTNFGKFLGPSEEGADESYSYSNGFHFGIEVLYSFNDYVSVGTEILYNQIGSAYKYIGPSYHIFTDYDNYVLTNDHVEYNLTISNSYINLPLNVYLKPIKKLEFKLGGYIGFLINPTANGKMYFGSKFNQTLDYNYYSDKTTSYYNTNYGSIQVKTPGEDGEVIRSTAKVAKAYHQYPSADYKDESFYNVMDAGLNLGLNYYINSSLYIGLNLQYGLLDITNDNLDRSLMSINEDGDSFFDATDSMIYRKDKDTNLNLQISLGFRF